MLHSVLTPGVPRAPEHLVWTGLGGDSLPLAIANAARQHDSLVVVVTPDMQSAELLQDQVTFFAAQQALPVTTFPDWETLPYDSFSPHPDIVSERLATLVRTAGAASRTADRAGTHAAAAIAAMRLHNPQQPDPENRRQPESGRYAYAPGKRRLPLCLAGDGTW